ncbi:hypothetical protein GQ457_16G017160 [Hibiscus cannabinus]
MILTQFPFLFCLFDLFCIFALRTHFKGIDSRVITGKKFIMNNRFHHQIEQDTNMKQYLEATTKGVEVCSSKGCTSSASNSTNKNEIQELKRQVAEMMTMMTDMAKEKERAKLK